MLPLAAFQKAPRVAIRKQLISKRERRRLAACQKQMVLEQPQHLTLVYCRCFNPVLILGLTPYLRTEERIYAIEIQANRCQPDRKITVELF